jgi:hypothetical protein
MTFSPQPGVLISTAARPKGFKPPRHPFIDARALDAGHEDTFATLLSAAKTADDFITALKARGYDVQEQRP